MNNPRDAQDLGIGMVYQHFTLVANMSVAENLVLSRSRPPFLHRLATAARRTALVHPKRMPFQIDPLRKVHSLAAGEKQKLEILKQLYLGSRIVILDEPTSVLTPAEADEVLGLLRDMTKSGEISVLMISHKFREVMSFADDVTVLRRGRLAGVEARVRGSRRPAQLAGDDGRRAASCPSRPRGHDGHASRPGTAPRRRSI